VLLFHAVEDDEGEKEGGAAEKGVIPSNVR
jgi:hypothetical protein